MTADARCPVQQHPGTSVAPYFCAPYLYFCTSLLPLKPSTPRCPLAAAFDIAHLLLAPSSIRPFNSPQSVLGAFSSCSSLLSLFLFFTYLGSIVPPVARRRQTPPPWIPFAPLSGHPNIIAALPRQPAPPSATRPATAAAPAHSLRSDHNRNSNDSYDDDLSTLSRPTSQLIASVALSLALLFWHPARPTRPLMTPFWSLLVLFIYPV